MDSYVRTMLVCYPICYQFYLMVPWFKHVIMFYLKSKYYRIHYYALFYIS